MSYYHRYHDITTTDIHCLGPTIGEARFFFGAQALPGALDIPGAGSSGGFGGSLPQGVSPYTSYVPQTHRGKLHGIGHIVVV